MVLFCLSPSPSVSRIVYAWYPSARSLRLRTLSLWGIFFWSYSSSCSVPWWEGPKGLLGELLQTWCSIGAPRDSIRFFRYYYTHCHSQSGMGISIWDTRELSHRDHSGFLLQHAQFRYLYTSVCYAHSRYMYRSHAGHCFRDTTHSKHIASWLSLVSTSDDCVQRRTSVSLLWDTFFMGWSSKHLMLGLCKRSKVP